MKQVLDNQQLNQVRKLCLENFWFFVQSLMDYRYYDATLHKDLCDMLQYSKPNKLVVLPRTFLKTTIAASYYPLWKATKDPGIRVLVVSNTSPNAEKTVRQIRTIVESNTLYQALFPEVIPPFSKVRWSDRCACLNRPEDFPEGTFESAGVGANIIRRHFNIIIEDDTVAPKRDELSGEEVMPSRDDIDQAIGFHRLTVPLLINEHDERIVVGTRWASYDLINYVMEQEHFDTFNRPAIVDDKPAYKRFSLERLDATRLALGSYMFSALYLNKPVSKEFMIFNPEWVNYYTEVPEDGDVVVTVDPADPPTGRKNQDYSAIVSAKHTKSGIFVLRCERYRITDRELIKRTLDIAALDKAVRIRVEIDRYAHLQFAFREEMAARHTYYSFDPVKTKGKMKEARIKDRLQPLFEAGVIKLKKGMSVLEDELFQFPHGVHDDLIDALAWQVEKVQPSEYKINKPKNTRTLPTVGEMYESLMRRRGVLQYPFQKQMGIEESLSIWQ